MDRTAANVGRISSMLYGVFRSLRLLDEGPARRLLRFAVGEYASEQALTVAYATIHFLDWSDLEPLIAEAILVLRDGATEVSISAKGMDVVRRR